MGGLGTPDENIILEIRLQQFFGRAAQRVGRGGKKGKTMLLLLQGDMGRQAGGINR